MHPWGLHQNSPIARGPSSRSLVKRMSGSEPPDRLPDLPTPHDFCTERTISRRKHEPLRRTSRSARRRFTCTRVHDVYNYLIYKHVTAACLRAQRRIYRDILLINRIKLTDQHGPLYSHSGVKQARTHLVPLGNGLVQYTPHFK